MIMDEREIRNFTIETVVTILIVLLFASAAIGIFFFYNAPIAFKIIAGIIYVVLGVLCMWPHVKGLKDEWNVIKKEKENDSKD